ncbi:hypothetical protein HPB48_026249 [Haemaphysalis longicornis]|uniref:PG1 pseudoGTPase domain-containing protein n=1 Tax=Haemaphysalis longicornis TaxID=44386 RepID=A0A9J6HBK8_HAELO|nr:hypothetical protein HPB48_026249 [Haemaphysalis longicornis]
MQRNLERNTGRGITGQGSEGRVALLTLPPHSYSAARFLVGNVINLFVAGSHTVAVAIHWHLLHLVNNADTWQARLQREIDDVVGRERQPTWEERNQMPFTMTCIWEMHRWKPSALPGIPRGIIDGDVGLPHNSFRTEPLPHGCLCVYASQPGLAYIRESLEKTLLANLEQEDRLPFHGLPLVMVFAGQGDFLREEGINRAKSLQCPFVDLGGSLDPVRLEQALCALVESIERRAGWLHIYETLPQPRGPGRTCG